MEETKKENKDIDLENANKKTVPAGLWTKCNKCGELLYKKELDSKFKVCDKCGYHFRMEVWERINLLIDKDTFKEHFANLTSDDPLDFKDLKSYKEKLQEAYEKTKKISAIVAGIGKLDDKKIALACMDFAFFGGSMDSVVGEKITRLTDIAIKQRLPLIIVSTSGGARMQESMFSLMQMAKTSAAIAKMGQAGLPYISILTDPTTGGVSASFAMLGDINIAEPEALIAFAGPRVIEQTIRQKLPDGFQKSEYLLKHGMVDMIVDRRNLKSKISEILDVLNLSKKEEEIELNEKYSKLLDSKKIKLSKKDCKCKSRCKVKKKV
jgi:acetyl-CoA carboxylase carboxyl transferase subunit beta